MLNILELMQKINVKRIAFNTDIPSTKNTLFRFKNQFTREHIWQLSDEDKDLLDLPVGYIIQ